jgi:hypothetical protein
MLELLQPGMPQAILVLIIALVNFGAVCSFMSKKLMKKGV